MVGVREITPIWIEMFYHRILFEVMPEALLKIISNDEILHLATCLQPNRHSVPFNSSLACMLPTFK